MTSRHEGVKCDACDANGFRLRRYKCLRCIDFDLCGNCFDNVEVTDQHHQSHPMQCIILDSDRKIFFPNAKPSEISRSYTCPVCGATGFKVADLMAHVEAKHPNAHSAVLCPLCIYPPPDNPVPAGCSPNRPYKKFLSHLVEAHRFKKSSPASSPQIQESADDVNASTEASLTRDDDYYYKPVDDAASPVLCGYDDLSPDEQIIDNLVSRSAFLSRVNSLNLRLQLEKLNSSPAVSNASVPSTSQSPKSTKMSELVYDSAQKEAGDNGTLSQSKGNASSNNNNEDDDVDEDEDSDIDVGDGIPWATGENRTDNGSDEDGSILVNSVSKAAEKDEVDKDGENCDQSWVTFVQELMWDSLHLERLSLTHGATD